MHLTPEQRYQIFGYLQAGYSQSRIASLLNRDKSVISRELGRNRGPAGYDPQLAERLSSERRKRTRKPYRLTRSMREYVEDLIRQDYSPEQIWGRSQLEGVDCVSVTTIYRYIWQNKEDRSVPSPEKLYHHLRIGRQRHNRRRAKRDGMGVIPDRVMIDQRPQSVNRRERLGDFEADTMWIAGKAALVTVVERRSRMSFIRAVPCRKAEVVEQALIDILKPLRAVAKTLTVDNGKEFYRHKKLAKKLGIDIYFAHPYRSGERGTNENTNGLYRQFFPKNTQLKELKKKDIMKIQNKLNQRPRKILGWKTPLEIFDTETKNETVAFQM